MISIIKTAIITIVISFISGLLLEYYKNLAPKILCNIGEGIPIEMNNKKICAYIITVRNISNKIIHELTLHVQSQQNNLRIGDAKITKGLKFDSSAKDNILDVCIPFLSKDDEFSVTVYVENQNSIKNKPVIILRSPEKFKEVDSLEQNGALSLLTDIPKNISSMVSKIMKKNKTVTPNKNNDFTMVMNKVSTDGKPTNKRNRETTYRNKNKKTGKNRIAVIITGWIILVASVGGIGIFYFKGMAANIKTPGVTTNSDKQSANTTESTNGTTRNSDAKTPSNGTSGSTGTKTSTNGTTEDTDQNINENTDTKESTGGASGNTDTKTSTSGSTGSTDTKKSTDGTTGSTDTKTSTSGSTGNADTKTSTGGTSGGTDTKSSTSGSTGSSDTKTSTGGSTGSSDTKTSTSGSTGSTGN